MNVAAFIFSNLNANTLSRLTGDRTVAAIPFACRYRLIDFALSNMVNAGIFKINVITNYNYRSLVEHIGSGKDWDLARRNTGVKVISPYQTAETPNVTLYTSHLEALLNVEKGYLRNLKEDTVVLSDCDYICNIDMADVIRRHQETDADMTAVTVKAPSDLSRETPKLMAHVEGDGHVRRFTMGTDFDGEAELCTNIFVFKKDYLLSLLEEAKRMNYTSLSRQVLLRSNAAARYYAYHYDGYFAAVSSFRDYFAYSIALTKDQELRRKLLGVEERPVFTNVHNSAPTLYKEGASVKDSMIADGCVIEGTVENSVLFRGVHVKKGAVVKNSVLFFGTTVEEDSSLHCVVADKSARIGSGVVLSGHPTIPLYIEKGQSI